MSTYTTGGAALRACTAAVQAAVPHLAQLSDALSRGLNSAALHSMAHQLADSPTAVTVSTTWSELTTALPNWSTALPQPLVADLQRVEQLTAQGLTADQDAAQVLRRALENGAQHLGMVERLAIAQAASVALSNLGYTVDRADGTQTTALDARRGHEVLLAVVGDGGDIQTDHAGLSGTSCLARQGAFRAEMHQLGVDLFESSRTDHRDHRGGIRIAGAARRGADSLARGALAERESVAARAPQALHGGPHLAAAPRRRRTTQ